MVAALTMVAVLSNVSAVERLVAIAKAMREREAQAAEAKRLAAEAALVARDGESEDEVLVRH
jgi:hypothetical protein